MAGSQPSSFSTSMQSVLVSLCLKSSSFLASSDKKLALFNCSLVHVLTWLQPLGAHIVGLAILSWFYIGWTYVGYIVTDQYTYWFLDHKQVGWEYVVAYWAGFAVLNNLGKSSSFLPSLHTNHCSLRFHLPCHCSS
jgi:hypothetical protein